MYRMWQADSGKAEFQPRQCGHRPAMNMLSRFEKDLCLHCNTYLHSEAFPPFRAVLFQPVQALRCTLKQVVSCRPDNVSIAGSPCQAVPPPEHSKRHCFIRATTSETSLKMVVNTFRAHVKPKDSVPETVTGKKGAGQTCVWGLVHRLSDAVTGRQRATVSGRGWCY